MPMLQLSGYLLNKPVLSLRTGGPVAYVTAMVINPKNLRVEGFYCADSLSGAELILVEQDIRELTRQGFIVDDHDVLVEPKDLVRLKAVLATQFNPIRLPVETVGKQKIGKVTDFALETSSMYIQKLYVAQSFWKSFTGGALSVDRSQIVEVTKSHIIIQDPMQPTTSPATAVAA